MSIKILGGFAKGFPIKSPPEKITRPTSVMLRRKFFDRYQDLSEIHFYDLCAGSGSIGLEAASRGASSVTFVESNKRALFTLEENTKAFSKKYSLESLKVIKQSFLSVLEAIEFEPNSVVFFDPPYEKLDLYESFFTRIDSLKTKPSLLVVEGCEQKTMPLVDFQKKFPGSFKVFMSYTYTCVRFMF